MNKAVFALKELGLLDLQYLWLLLMSAIFLFVVVHCLSSIASTWVQESRNPSLTSYFLYLAAQYLLHEWVEGWIIKWDKETLMEQRCYQKTIHKAGRAHGRNPSPFPFLFGGGRGWQGGHVIVIFQRRWRPNWFLMAKQLRDKIGTRNYSRQWEVEGNIVQRITVH